MSKAWTIAWKDTIVRLRDRSALLYLLLTPLLLTFLMGTVFGGGGDDEGFVPPPADVALVNRDEGELGAALVRRFLEEPSIRELAHATQVEDEGAARAAMAAGERFCCMVLIPPTFSASLSAGDPIELVVVSDPATPMSGLLVEGIVRQVVADMVARATTVGVTLEGLAQSGRIREPAALQSLGTALAAAPPTEGAGLTLRTVDQEGEQVTFDVLAYLAPGIALLFLSFGAAQAGQSLVAEEESGTLARLAVTPTPPAAILGGKLIGVFLLGLLQFGVLMAGGVLFFGIRWGDPLAVTVLSLMLVVAFTALGLLLAAWARSQEQASTLGTVVSLLFALLGGTFINIALFPNWLRTIGRVTPNAWGMEAFTKLGLGQPLSAIFPELGGLLLLSILLFLLALLGYRRRPARLSL